LPISSFSPTCSLFYLDFPKVFVEFQAKIQSKIGPPSSKLGSLIKMRDFWVCFIVVRFIPMLVLQWWLLHLCKRRVEAKRVAT